MLARSEAQRNRRLCQTGRDNRGTVKVMVPREDGFRVTPPGYSGGAGFFNSARNAAGLKLAPDKTGIERLVILHIDSTPTGN